MTVWLFLRETDDVSVQTYSSLAPLKNTYALAAPMQTRHQNKTSTETGVCVSVCVHGICNTSHGDSVADKHQSDNNPETTLARCVGHVLLFKLLAG